MTERSYGLLLLGLAGVQIWYAWRHWTGRILTDRHPDGFWSRAYVTLAWYGVAVTVMGLALLAADLAARLELPYVGIVIVGVIITGILGITGLSFAPWLLRHRRPDWQRVQVAWVREQEASDDPVPWWDRPDHVRFGGISRAEERERRASHVTLSNLREALGDDPGPSVPGAASDELNLRETGSDLRRPGVTDRQPDERERP